MKLAGALAIVYVVWGSTYLGMAVADRTLPPLLMLSVRFLIAGALDELGADDALERLDLLADRRLGVAEPLGGTAEGSLLGDRLERREMTNLDTEPSIRAHDQYE